MSLQADLSDRIKLMDALPELRKKAEYYKQHDYPGSWYSRNPSDSVIKVPYKTLLLLLDEIDNYHKGVKP